jgi:hypothetical protein
MIRDMHITQVQCSYLNFHKNWKIIKKKLVYISFTQVEHSFQENLFIPMLNILIHVFFFFFLRVKHHLFLIQIVT